MDMHSTRFFSSLSRVEKRVRSETRQPDPTPSPPTSSSQSLLSAPLFLLSQSVQNDPVSLPPSQSQTLNCPPRPEDIHDSRRQSSDLYGDIEVLSRMVGVSGEDRLEGGGDGEEEGKEDGFYERVAGMKGPRCRKEEKRLEGWIRHYLGSKEEPLRLVHLMIGRVTVDDAEFEFPSTVAHFLHVDPPIPCCSDQDK